MNGVSMASDNINVKMLKPLDEMLRCSICTEFFNNCVMTSCCHDFCSACIKKRMATELDCPICYEDLRESDLRSNDSMDKIVRIYKKLTRSNAKASSPPASTPPAPKRLNVRLATSSFSAERANESPLTVKETSASLPSTRAQCRSCAKNEGFHSTILTGLRELKEEVAMLRQDVNCFVQRLDVKPPDTEKTEDIQLMAAGEMKLLEVELQSDEKFSKMVKNLGNFGGRDCYEVTRRILAALLSFEAACGFNWNGGYGKLGMKTFPRVLQMISAAVRQNPATKIATQADVEFIVKRWLWTASDRNRGRNKRKNAE
ncbi:uncharacterized protein [Parasteatoda tepidariorum]|uniref:uncharacterized protein isoform X1 n=1 Tax=Parasteatoda tepidariorum TaxID=114398 RepID=UPI001C71A7D7|nr:tripartite motif-containing protein 60 isoform X1 [Parasteatoda tepidariorum]